MFNHRFFCVLFVEFWCAILYEIFVVGGGGLSDIFNPLNYTFSHLYTAFFVNFILFYIFNYFENFGVAVEKIYTAIMVFFGLFETIFIVKFRDSFNINFLEAFLGTNFDEISEFFAFYGVRNLYFCLIYLAICAIFLVPKFCPNFIKNLSQNFHAKLPKIWLFVTFFIYLFLFLWAFRLIFLPNRLVLANYTHTFGELIKRDEIFIDTQKLREILENERKNYSCKMAENSEISTIGVILGESLSRRFMGVYGFLLPTTPNFSKMAENGELIVIPSPKSADTFTIGSLKKSLNLGPKNLVNIAKNSGFETFWLSNQSKFSGMNYAFTATALLSDHEFWTTNLAVDNDFGDVRVSFDENLLRIFDEISGQNLGGNFAAKNLDKILATPENFTQNSTPKKPQFFIFHLMGSHAEYQKRYPAKFSVFDASEAAKFVKFQPAPKNAPKILANYLNSVLYNDFVVSEIFARFKEREAIVFYFSDHGLDLFENGDEARYCGEFCRAVPFLIYISPTLKAKRPELENAVKSIITPEFDLANFSEALMKIVGISCVDLR